MKFSPHAAVVVVAAGIALGGCHEDSEVPPDSVTRPPTPLEQALLTTRISVCGLRCRTYAVTYAWCARRGRFVDGRRYFRCRTKSEQIGGNERGPVETVCAALGGDRGYIARELGDCRSW